MDYVVSVYLGNLSRIMVSLLLHCLNLRVSIHTANLFSFIGNLFHNRQFGVCYVKIGFAQVALTSFRY